MVVVPAVAPVTRPVTEPIVALAVLVLLQVPPLTVLVRVTVKPVHTVAAPDITDGAVFTLTVCTL